MLKLIFYIIWVANIILVVLKRKSKFLSALSFVLSFVVLAGNTYNLDYMTYYWSYTHQDFDTLDKGYQLLCRIFIKIGLDYQAMLMVLQSMMLIVLWLCIRSITNNYNVFWALYFFAQQFIDVIQFRNYIATVFLMGSLFLLKNGKRWMSFLILIGAVGFHKSFALYIPFVLLYNNRRIKVQFNHIASVLILTFCILYPLNAIAKINVFSVLLSALNVPERYSYYITGTRYGSVAFFFLYLINLYCINSVKENFWKNTDDAIGDVVLKINLYSAVVLPFLIVNTNVYRLYRNLNLMNFIFISAALGRSKKLTKRYYYEIGKILLMGMIWKALFMTNPSIYVDIYTNNILL